MTIEYGLAIALWLVAWSLVLMRWRSRRIEADHAASLLAVTSAGSLALYSFLRPELNAVIVLVVVMWSLVGFAFSRYILRVLGNDRPRADGSTTTRESHRRP